MAEKYPKKQKNAFLCKRCETSKLFYVSISSFISGLKFSGLSTFFFALLRAGKFKLFGKREAEIERFLWG